MPDSVMLRSVKRALVNLGITSRGRILGGVLVFIARYDPFEIAANPGAAPDVNCTSVRPSLVSVRALAGTSTVE